MHKNDRIFVDGLAAVRMNNGVVQLEFYNNRSQNGSVSPESCGEIVMSQQGFLQAYTAMDDLVKKMLDAGLVRRNGDNNGDSGIAGVQPVKESSSPNFE